jgi:hypothetical protein
MRAHEFINEPRFDMGKLRLLSEAPARLSRLQSHAQAHPFIMISAARGDLTVADNKKRSVALMQSVRSHGLGAIQIEGHWVEENGPVTEPSFFIPLTGPTTLKSGDELLTFGRALGQQFQQEAILYGDGQWVYQVDCATGEFTVEAAVHHITQQQLGEIYSRIRNRRFKFRPPDDKTPVPEYHMIGYRVPTGYISAVGMASVGLWPESK